MFDNTVLLLRSMRNRFCREAYEPVIVDGVDIDDDIKIRLQPGLWVRKGEFSDQGKSLRWGVLARQAVLGELVGAIPSPKLKFLSLDKRNDFAGETETDVDRLLSNNSPTHDASDRLKHATAIYKAFLPLGILAVAEDPTKFAVEPYVETEYVADFSHDIIEPVALTTIGEKYLGYGIRVQLNSEVQVPKCVFDGEDTTTVPWGDLGRGVVMSEHAPDQILQLPAAVRSMYSDKIADIFDRRLLPKTNFSSMGELIETAGLIYGSFLAVGFNATVANPDRCITVPS